MRLVGMKARHLLENTRGVPLDGRRRRALYQTSKRLLIGGSARWQPQRRTCKLIDPKRGAQAKRLPAKGPREQRHVAKIVIRTGPGPTGGGVAYESEHDGSKGSVGGRLIDAVNAGSRV